MRSIQAFLVVLLASFALVACGGAKDDNVASEFTSTLDKHRQLVKKGEFKKGEFLEEIKPIIKTHSEAIAESENDMLAMSAEVKKDYLRAIEDFSRTALESANSEAQETLTIVLAEARGN